MSNAPLQFSQKRRNTFIVRIWREQVTGRAAVERWSGYIQHVRSGDERYVRSIADIVAFFELHAGELEEE
jgi:hypothetical protein